MTVLIESQFAKIAWSRGRAIYSEVFLEAFDIVQSGIDAS